MKSYGIMTGLLVLTCCFGCYQGPMAVSPFSAEQASRYQKLTAEYLGLKTVEKEINLGNMVTMGFVLIPPGEFTMGVPEEYNPWDTESPQHRVRISQPFWMGKYEVTQREWQAVMGTLPWRIMEEEKNPEFPIFYISWREAYEFCTKLHVNHPKLVFRLPTEAEWEYSCRAGTESAYYSGNALPEFLSNICDNNKPQSLCEKAAVVPVGKYPSNPFGLFDVYGNVSEMCMDRYDAQEYKRRSAMTIDPLVKYQEGHLIAIRGGSCRTAACLCYSGRRAAWSNDQGLMDLGFRIVIEGSGEE